jgi:pyruvate kinase
MKTKIVATIGPASREKEVLKQMIQAGVDVCRLNMSHDTHEEHLRTIKVVEEINAELNTNVAILADLQGPKIRIGEVENNGVLLENGNELVLTTNKCIGTRNLVYITYPSFAKDVSINEEILLDDGKLLLRVVETNGIDTVRTVVEHGGILSSRKGVNLPRTRISLPSLCEKDLRDLEFILNNNVHWVGLSFVRSASDIIDLKHMMASKGKKDPPRIIAKIEKPEALADIDAIIREADGLMVARGDLGVEVPLEQVPLIQKMLIKKCLEASKPIIVATQMMEGMITNIRPTRAEVNDVANSVLDGADALMLSGETSVGEHPIDVVKTMRRIIESSETYEDIYFKDHEPVNSHADRFLSDSILFNACQMAKNTKANGIIVLTHSGYSAFRIASHRPKACIYIFTNNKVLLNTLNLVWGVRGFYYDKFISTDHTIEDIKYRLRKEGLLKSGDMVVNTASTPLSDFGMTNMIKLSYIE